MEHPFDAKIRKMLIAIAVLAFLSMGVTAYLIYLHYVPAATSICEINEQFNCDVVNKSQWSYIAIGPVKIPVAIMGFLYYLGIFIGTVGVLGRWPFTRIIKWFEPSNMIRLMRWFTYIGLPFTLYLTYIEAFVLHTFCLFCVAQQFLILGILGLFLVIKFSGSKKGHGQKGCCCTD